MRTDYFLYMAECSGMDQLTSTRESRINAAINDFIHAYRAGRNINDDDLQDAILSRHNLTSLTAAEKARIAKEVGRKA